MNVQLLGNYCQDIYHSTTILCDNSYFFCGHAWWLVMNLCCYIHPSNSLKWFTDPKVVVEYGGGGAPILFAELTCTGTEHNLLECGHSKTGRHNCFEFLEKIGVSCGKLLILTSFLHTWLSAYYSFLHMIIWTKIAVFFFLSAPPCIEGELRLLKDRVQICQNTRWSYVCKDDGWSLENTRVVCRQLGFSAKGCIECASWIVTILMHVYTLFCRC